MHGVQSQVPQVEQIGTAAMQRPMQQNLGRNGRGSQQRWPQAQHDGEWTYPLVSPLRCVWRVGSQVAGAAVQRLSQG